MTCYHPIPAFRTPHGVVFSELRRHDILGDISIPCGQCIGCRMRRASDWELRVMHEAQLHEESCFVTLTYGRDKLPPHGSLCHEDYQKFMKRVRRKFGPVRFYMCGEYGPLHKRPHYHACLFGVSFRDGRIPAGKSASGMLFYDQPELSRLWGHGRVSVQDLTRETAGYCARYIMKKVLGDSADEAYSRVDADGVVVPVRPEYAAMSLKPAIGAGWYARFSRDVRSGDSVVAAGVERPVPKHYDRLYKRVDPAALEEVKYERELKAREHFEEQSDARLQVRETVHTARMSSFTRGVE